jgi:hypothetical protein
MRYELIIISAMKLLLASAQGRNQKICSIKDNVKFKYSECDPLTMKTNVHFFYDPADNCAPPREEDETGKIIKEDGSDPMPPYL